MGKPLTEQQFNTITAQLRKKSNDIAKVAEASGFKVSTIKAIRRAQTWQHYQAVRKAQGEKIKALHKLDKITKAGQTMQAQPLIAEIKPGTIYINGVRVVNSPRTKITDGHVPGNPNSSISRAELNLALKPLLRRISDSETAIVDMQTDAIKNDIQDRRTFLARFRRGQR